MSYETDHPASADLLAVVLGTLDGEDRDPIEEHLSRCPECAQTVLDFNSFPDLEPVDEESPEMRARLEDQKRRLIEMGRREEAGPLEAPGDVIRGPWLARAEVAWGVAAVFFVATVGLAVWSATSNALAPTVFFGAVTSTRGEEITQIPLFERPMVVLLALQGRPQDSREYRVDLEDIWGEKVDSQAATLRQERYLQVKVPRKRISLGLYRFEVLEIESGQERRLGSWVVEFVAPPKGQTEDE